MQFFRFWGVIAALFCLCLPAYAELATPPAEPPPPIETDFAIPDVADVPDTLPGYRGEQKPAFPGMDAPPVPPAEPVLPASP